MVRVKRGMTDGNNGDDFYFFSSSLFFFSLFGSFFFFFFFYYILGWGLGVENGFVGQIETGSNIQEDGTSEGQTVKSMGLWF